MKKVLPIGIESFDKLFDWDCYYVDKTLLIKELIDRRCEVTLITRPRRFGKTLALSMLSRFFDITRDSREMFSNLDIMEHGDIVGKHMNKYPVIFLSLKDVVSPNHEGALEKMADVISALYREKSYLVDGERAHPTDTLLHERYSSLKATSGQLELSLLHLSRMLHSYHKKRVIVLLDEYDAPIDNAEAKGFYGDMIEFMRGFMGSTLKSNDHLEFAVVTGVQRIAQEGLFSKLNNPKVYGILNSKYSSQFGFTEEEVADMCKEYDAGNTMDEIRAFYDGYRFGDKDMYNPWSILNYLSSFRSVR